MYWVHTVWNLFQISFFCSGIIIYVVSSVHGLKKKHQCLFYVYPMAAIRVSRLFTLVMLLPTPRNTYIQIIQLLTQNANPQIVQPSLLLSRQLGCGTTIRKELMHSNRRWRVNIPNMTPYCNWGLNANTVEEVNPVIILETSAVNHERMTPPRPNPHPQQINLGTAPKVSLPGTDGRNRTCGGRRRVNPT